MTQDLYYSVLSRPDFLLCISIPRPSSSKLLQPNPLTDRVNLTYTQNERQNPVKSA
jgi:hypothetical protein